MKPTSVVQSAAKKLMEYSAQIKASTNKMQKRVAKSDAFLHFFSI